MSKTRTYSGSEATSWTACEAVEKLMTGEVTPTELIDAAVTRIEQVDGAVNAVVTVCAERAKEKALHIKPRDPKDKAGYLAGLPLGIKDLTAVEGVRTTFGNMAYRDHVPTFSDPVVEKIEHRGGIILGKTNTPEFGAGANTFNEVFGMTRNPYDTRLNAGGSSGGAAVSLATGCLWLSHGTDLAGSLRTPASFNNVVGLRPTPGRCASLSPATFLVEGAAGPMARNIHDLALFLDAMTGTDDRIPLSLERPTRSFLDSCEDKTRQLKIAFSVDQGKFAPVESNIRDVLQHALGQISQGGHIVEDFCPELPSLYETYVTIRGIHYASIPASQPAHVQKYYKKTLADNVASGLALNPEQIFACQRQRTVLVRKMAEFFATFDLLAIPVTGIAPGPVEVEYPLFVDNQPQEDYVDWLRFSFLATTCGLPALSLPAGFTEDGLPVGIQLIGKPRGEAQLLHAGRMIEDILNIPSSPIDPNIRHEC
ncbi:MAG: amidase [Alphaproteobacteria bacterium]|nr:amidase [Alphaproteobacteria bacterium]